ncbi:hypothetical protein C0993_002081 [Termitomyces sp. T159_Od127]|nr:hypothetical protein C0993_002081 [Termitomyces sp. T159_Od127]
MPKGSWSDEQAGDHPGALAPSPLLHSPYGGPRSPTLQPSDDWLDSPSLTATVHNALCSSDSAPADSQLSFVRHPDPHMPLPDPSQFPDPYPFRPPHHRLPSVPALSSTSSSTRSSAYTSSASGLTSGDYAHVHVASGDDDESTVGVGITSDAVVQLLAKDPAVTSSARGIHSRTPVDQSRWSESYSNERSSSSFVSNSNPGNVPENRPRLQQKPSYDMGWVDERDEVGMSEEETDDDNTLDDDEDEEKEEERTSAVVIAEEGRGLIVQGDNVPITQLQVPPGTTHLLIGSSSTPNAMPTFLTATLPQICHSLLALDISANFLGALPPVLAICERLEELNIAFNPLRVLPVFLADLTNLRVIIADSTGIGTLPESLADLDKLHTISVRKNKLNALPSWLCLLPALNTLCVDGNPFQGPWKALVEPLLTKLPVSPSYPLSTPIFPVQSMGVQSSSNSETDTIDIDDFSDTSLVSGGFEEHTSGDVDDEDQTITLTRAAPVLGRSVTAPLPAGPHTAPSGVGLTRTRTTPNRNHFETSRAKTAQTSNQSDRTSKPEEFGSDRELRKMKSAGDLRRGKTSGVAQPGPSPSMRPTLSNYTTSVSSSNLLGSALPSPLERTGATNRYATMGPRQVPGDSSARSNTNEMRTQLTKSMWDTPSNHVVDLPSSAPNRVSLVQSSTILSPAQPSIQDIQDGKYPNRVRSTKDGKEKGSRWGFLKKMSMGKMKVESPSSAINQNHAGSRPQTPAGPMPRNTGLRPERSKTPQIDLRFSTTGTLDVLSHHLSAPSSPPNVSKEPSRDALKIVLPESTTSLAPPSPLPRAARRRSFLPIDAPGSLSLQTQESSVFVPALSTLDGEDDEQRVATPVGDSEQYLRREEERAREAYNRALRSVMAYLKDMNDLGLSQQARTMSMYGAAADDVAATRSRRPTVVDGQREVSMALSGSTGSSDSNGQLRSNEIIAGLRSGSSAQTLSIATTDSTGSSYEERKFKDDKGKRAMIVREIVATERTYVKGLQELMDIYIKPACETVNILSGVGSNKDTVVPAAERKLVFGGIDALFSFHNDSFLQALEVAAAPLMKSSESLQQADADGQLSLNVVKAVGCMFLKHAAFMKMYSSYINPASSTISPSSSTGQLVGVNATPISAGTLDASSVTAGVPNLSSSQRKRIKSYLKRCRLNPRHSQLNLEGYLLLPVQRIPRYRLLVRNFDFDFLLQAHVVVS